MVNDSETACNIFRKEGGVWDTGERRKPCSLFEDFNEKNTDLHTKVLRMRPYTVVPLLYTHAKTKSHTYV